MSREGNPGNQEHCLWEGAPGDAGRGRERDLTGYDSTNIFNQAAVLSIQKIKLKKIKKKEGWPGHISETLGDKARMEGRGGHSGLVLEAQERWTRGGPGGGTCTPVLAGERRRRTSALTDSRSASGRRKMLPRRQGLCHSKRSGGSPGEGRAGEACVPAPQPPAALVPPPAHSEGICLHSPTALPLALRC